MEPPAKKSIKLSEVLLFVQYASPSIVLKVYQAAGEKLGFKTDDPSEQDGEMFGSMGDVLAAMLEGQEGESFSSDRVSIKDQLAAKVDAASVLDSVTVPDMEFQVVVMSRNDKADSTDVQVKDEAAKMQLGRLLEICGQKSLYFPYGMGISKDQLRIKKMPKNLKAGQVLKVKVHFRSWTFESKGTSGFSCYLKK